MRPKAPLGAAGHEGDLHRRQGDDHLRAIKMFKGWLESWTCVDRQGCVEWTACLGWTDGRTDGRMDGWMDGWMDGRAGGQREGGKEVWKKGRQED